VYDASVTDKQFAASGHARVFFVVLMASGCGGRPSPAQGDAGAMDAMRTVGAAGASAAGTVGGAGNAGAAGASGGAAGAHGDAGLGEAGDVGGLAGTGGSLAGIGGAAGEPAPVCVNQPGQAPACGAALCGNGKRDRCLVTACSDGTVSSPGETCDTADLNGASCLVDGWGSGEMRCTATCALDRSACNSCLPLSTSLLACGVAPVETPNIVWFQIAATDAEVGLAWSALDGRARPMVRTLSFARLSPTLASLGVTTLEMGTPESDTAPYFQAVVVAPRATGWIVTATTVKADPTITDGGVGELFFHALDAAGKDLGRVFVDKVSDPMFALRFVTVAPRPNGAPLIVWGGEHLIRAAVIAADGRSAGKPVDVSIAGLMNVEASNAVFFGDAFYVVYSGTDMETFAGVTRLVRFDAGAAKTFDLSLEGRLVELALAAGSNELRLTYHGPGATADSDPVTRLQRFTPVGSAVGTPINLRPSAMGLVGIGDSSVIFASDVVGNTIGFERFSSTGAAVTDLRNIAKFPPNASVTNFTAAGRGREVVGAWLEGTPSVIKLVRISP
jgi:hypothetical protein